MVNIDLDEKNSEMTSRDDLDRIMTFTWNGLGWLLRTIF